MLSPKDLSRIVKDEIENHEKDEKLYRLYYILLNRKMCPQGDYNKEVAEGRRSANDIYAFVDVLYSLYFEAFLFYIDYLTTASVIDFVEAYLRKMGFTIKRFYDLPPIPNLKYFIDVNIARDKDHKPEYLVVNVYDIDALARTFHIPQIVEQKLGSQPREITEDEVNNINDIVIDEQPLLAGHTYDDAWDILYAYYVDHEEAFRDEVDKIVLAYFRLFPTPYRVCYEWKAGIFVETDCLKLELLKRLKRSS